MSYLMRMYIYPSTSWVRETRGASDDTMGVSIYVHKKGRLYRWVVALLDGCNVDSLGRNSSAWIDIRHFIFIHN